MDNSITGPAAFIQTNIVGTFQLLQSAYQLWMEGPNQLKLDFDKARFLHVSTDEVYGTLGETGLFTEETLCSKQSIQLQKPPLISLFEVIITPMDFRWSRPIALIITALSA